MAPARLGIAGLVSVMVVLAVSPAVAVADPRADMVNAVNAFRAAHGRHALAPSQHLARSSQAQALRVLRRNRFAHGASSARRGEVLAIHYGTELLIPNVIQAWDNSEGHRNLLLDGSFRTVGAAYARGRFNGRQTMVWVVRVQR
ncbi:MAG: CAP domain-containing protein [Thermoleophilaceae bacterium]